MGQYVIITAIDMIGGCVYTSNINKLCVGCKENAILRSKAFLSWWSPHHFLFFLATLVLRFSQLQYNYVGKLIPPEGRLKQHLSVLPFLWNCTMVLLQCAAVCDMFLKKMWRELNHWRETNSKNNTVYNKTILSSWVELLVLDPRKEGQWHLKTPLTRKESCSLEEKSLYCWEMPCSMTMKEGLVLSVMSHDG